MRQFFVVIFVVLSLSIFAPKQTNAASFGDTALTVGISAGVGAVLGASTLPFYSEPGDHTNNIWVGAAIGAVLGVTLAAVNALSSPPSFDFEEGDEYQQADDDDFALLSKELLQTNDLNARGRETVVFWTPVQSFRF